MVPVVDPIGRGNVATADRLPHARGSHYNSVGPTGLTHPVETLERSYGPITAGSHWQRGPKAPTRVGTPPRPVARRCSNHGGLGGDPELSPGKPIGLRVPTAGDRSSTEANQGTGNSSGDVQPSRAGPSRTSIRPGLGSDAPGSHGFMKFPQAMAPRGAAPRFERKKRPSLPKASDHCGRSAPAAPTTPPARSRQKSCGQNTQPFRPYLGGAVR